MLLGKIGVFHNRRNASSRLLLLISKHLILCIYLVFRILACFFFQAEGGIRDRTVTGVQTCALPIFGHRLPADLLARRKWGFGVPWNRYLRTHDAFRRSEERRVGKECRALCNRHNSKRRLLVLISKHLSCCIYMMFIILSGILRLTAS